MNIGDKILENQQVVKIAKIKNIVPVQYKDDGDNNWYEICDAMKSDQRLVVVEDIMGNEINVIIDKDLESLSILLDLF